MNNFVTEILTAKTGRTHIFSTGQAGFIIKSSSGQIVGVDLYMKTVKVFDAEGKNLLLKGFDVDKALELNFSGE